MDLRVTTEGSFFVIDGGLDPTTKRSPLPEVVFDLENFQFLLPVVVLLIYYKSLSGWLCRIYAQFIVLVLMPTVSDGKIQPTVKYRDHAVYWQYLCMISRTHYTFLCHDWPSWHLLHYG